MPVETAAGDLQRFRQPGDPHRVDAFFDQEAERRADPVGPAKRRFRRPIGAVEFKKVRLFRCHAIILVFHTPLYGTIQCCMESATGE